MLSARRRVVLAITGYRECEDYEHFVERMQTWIEENRLPDEIISGGAHGVDAMAARYAGENEIPFREYAANWYPTEGGGELDRSAGPRRNTTLVEAATHVLAFYSPHGRGTQDTMKKARRRGLRVTSYRVDERNQITAVADATYSRTTRGK